MPAQAPKLTLLPTIKGPKDLKALSVDQLEELAAEIRAAIIHKVSASGGHLAPNLGVVELTIAMHYVFDFAHDRLLFDVGHQCYPHKLLTGRLDLLDNLRTRSGMSGFPEPRESAFDLFSVGHAGTAISTAVGMARGDSLNNEAYDHRDNPTGRRVVSIIGDASIVNGLAMEGLNNAGTLQRQFLVVLNDNGMSISKPQGAMAQYFDRIRLNPLYGDVKRRAKRVLSRVPGGGLVGETYHRMTESMKALVTENAWFEHFGLITVGPIDGHHLPSLIESLIEARDFERPMVLHVKTTKGKGLDYAERDATTFHSPAAHTYDPDSCRVEMRSSGRSYTSAFGDALRDIMERDDRTVACTAAMPGGTGTEPLLTAFPTRTFDTGICESHAMDMMAGMAKTGLRPFFAVYSTFLQRAFDQAFQEVALQSLGVRLCLDRAGLVGGDGAVHHGFCDISILSALPGAVLLAPIDEASLRAGLEFMRTQDDNLSAIRYPRDSVVDHLIPGDCPPFELGKARPLIEFEQGKADVAVLAYGVTAVNALAVAKDLAPEVRVSLYDARFAKPVDGDLIERLVNAGTPIVTLEDHSVVNGFGAAVLQEAARRGLTNARITIHGLPDSWVYQDGRNAQLAEVGLDKPGIARIVRAAAEGDIKAISAVEPAHRPTTPGIA